VTNHRVDASSFVLGVLASVLGLTAWTGRLGELVNHPSAAVPLAIGLVGAALIASTRRSSDVTPPPPPEPAAAPVES
jgi:hypothetical protein